MKKIAVIGATGNVGKIVVEKLTGKADLTLFSSKDELNFKDFYICIFATNDEVSKKFVPEALKEGAYVVDASSYYRLNEDVLLVVEPVNGHVVEKKQKFYASANCIASPLSIVLAPLKRFGIESVYVSTYQAISGAGKEALARFQKDMILDIVPQISDFMNGGVSKEEYKIVHETQKILDAPFNMTVTAVRVPVVRGHAISMSVVLNNTPILSELEEIYRDMPMIQYLKQSYNTPAQMEGEDILSLGRLRQDVLGVHMWICTDNLHRGAALDIVEITNKILSF